MRRELTERGGGLQVQLLETLTVIGRRVSGSPSYRTSDERQRHGAVALGVGCVLRGKHGEMHFEPRMVGRLRAFDELLHLEGIQNRR